nr:MAG TPA: N-acetyltransferase [Bacteriophage sp.]
MCKTTIGYVHTVTTAAVEVKFYGEELDLMEAAARAANHSLSEFAAEAALEYAEIYLRTYAAADADIRIKHGLI